jgi:hypothetical protein
MQRQSYWLEKSEGLMAVLLRSLIEEIARFLFLPSTSLK